MNSAAEKEIEVCPEGNDWLPPLGLVSCTLYFNPYVTPSVSADDSASCKLPCQSRRPSVKPPAVAGRTICKASPAEAIASLADTGMAAVSHNSSAMSKAARPGPSDCVVLASVTRQTIDDQFVSVGQSTNL